MILMHGKPHWIRPHDTEGWIELAVEREGYAFPCPHCRPSYFTFKPDLRKENVCCNAGTDVCKSCYEPECELSEGN